MDKLPICRLCKCAPLVDEDDSLEDGKKVTHPGRNDCPASGVSWMTPEKWIALMGEDRDAVRYRWLREKIKSLELVIAKEGSWALVSWSCDQPDEAIDAAMKEQE